MVRSKFLKTGIAAFVAAAAFGAAPAYAAITVETSASGGGNESNVLFNGCDLGSASGGLIACFNSAPDTLVRFTSDDDTLVYEAGGQARIESSTDGLIDDLTIDLIDDDLFFNQLVFSLTGEGTGNATLGTIGIDGNDYDITANGQNFFTLTFDTPVNSFSFFATGSFIVDVRHVRIRLADGDEPTPVPEPAILGLMGLGLLGLGAARRRKAA